MRRMSTESSRSGCSGAKPNFLRSNSFNPASIGPSGATAAQQQQSLIVAVPVSIRGRRLRQILRCLPIDMMEVQLLAREFFSRCDLQEKYMSLDKCVETFALSPSMIRSVHSYIRSNNLVDDVPFNYARKLALLYLQSVPPKSDSPHQQTQSRQNELARIYNDAQPTGQDKGLHLHTPRKSMLDLPSLYLTFENFVEAAVYLSPRASMQQRIDLAFHVFDSDNTGVIEVEQIRDVMLDSLQANMADGSVEQMFVNEVDELVSDLKEQYGSQGLRKDAFIEFAQNPEFLNCFTVNKHWLRDILGNDKHNTRYARPQDAEMKQFLAEMASTHGLRSEQIIDLQETLRDHLVDTIEDLQTVSQKHFDQMHINRRVSTAIFKQLKRVQSEHNDDFDFAELNGAGGSGFWDSVQRMSMAIGNRVSMVGSSALQLASMDKDVAKSPTSAHGIDLDYDILQRNNTHLTLAGYMQRRLPSPYAMMRIAWHTLYCLQLCVSLLIMPQSSSSSSSSSSSATRTMATLTGHGLYLCLFLMPLSHIYSILTRLFSLTTNSNAAYCVLFVTSKESQRVNFCYAVVYALIHCFCHLLQGTNLTLDVSLISALLMAALGAIRAALAIYVTFHQRRRSRDTFNPYTTANVSTRWLFRATMAAAFVLHCATVPAGSAITLWLLCVSLIPAAVTIAAHVCVFTLCSRPMEVELAKNERPNYVLLSIRNDREKMGKWRCGQYVTVKCPSISSVEYHPFYITSSPDDRWLNLSVLNCGDWTHKLWHLYVSEHNNELPDLQVCGPFGIGFDANKMNYNFDYLLIVAAGNGSVEIIASLLNFVCSNFLSNADHPITKIYFYWMVCVDDGCQWFYKLLRSLRNTYTDAFFPCIFVQSSKHDDKNSNAFGLNFFLALRRESVETNLVQNVRLSAGRISNFRRPVSVFAPNSRASRFHQPNSPNLLGSLNEKMPLAQNAADNSEDDIPMRSPDFRHAFNKIRDELMQKNADINRLSSITAPSPFGPSARSKPSSTPKKSSMHGIVPALMVSANSAESGMAFRRYYVGTFFVGTDILHTRLQRLCQQFSDEQVVFEMNSMLIGDNYVPTSAT